MPLKVPLKLVMLRSLLPLLLASAATAFVIIPVRPTAHRALLQPTMAGTGAGGVEEGFNSFNRWPSASAINLTSSAWSFFGLEGEKQHALSLDEMRDLVNRRFDRRPEALDSLMKCKPLADQRGEKVLLDVNRQGKLEWTTVV